MNRSNDDFIQMLSQINPNITALESYAGTNKKIPCRCQKCGYEWMALPKVLLRSAKGKGCPNCSGNRKLTNEEFLMELRKLTDSIQPLDEYNGKHNKIKFRCKICSNIWAAEPSNLLKGTGCPSCARKSTATKLRKTDSEFKRELAIINSDIDVLETYKDSGTPVLCRCKKCGYEWKTRPQDLLRGKGCIRCAGLLKKTHSQFVKELMNVNPSIKPLEEYVNAGTNIKFHCNICGYEWNTSPRMLLSGSGCPKCKGNKKKTNEEFLQELLEINTNIKPLEDYKNARTKIKCRCKVCGYEWKATPAHLLHGIGCPSCCHIGTSFVEQLIYQSFLLLLGDGQVINRDRYTIDMEIDIYVPRFKLAIEYGAWFWHKDSYEYDIEKQKQCKNKDIRLITIYDKCSYESIDGFDDLILYPYELGTESGLVTIKGLLSKWCNEYHLDYSVIDKNWKSIKSKAQIASRKKTTEQLSEELKNRNTDIEILGEYKSANSPVLCHCKKCGYEWEARPSNLLRGTGCPKCVGRVPITNDEFLRLLLEVNESIEPLEKYLNSQKKILCRCKKCGYEWYALPYNLLRGSGCPKCAGNVKRTNDEFMEMLRNINSEIEPLEEYKNNNTRILVQCKICGYKWQAIPSYLLKRGNCPKCNHTTPVDNDTFIHNLSMWNPDVEALEKYKNSQTKIMCRCRKCGYEWKVKPNMLQQGNGCPKCAGSLKKTNTQFISEIHEKNPYIEPLEEYKNNKTKLLYRCKKCGHEWRAKPNSILSGSGCPKCGIEKISTKIGNPVYCIETKKVYPSARKAAVELGLSGDGHIGECCKGKLKTAGGFHWRFMDNVFTPS